MAAVNDENEDENENATSTSAVTPDEPREGSSLYYSLLWTPAESRRRFLDTLFLIDALAMTLDDVQDAGVAEQKVHWWHEELQRLTLGSARHPRTSPCEETPTASGRAQTRLLKILSTSANTRFEPAASDAEHDSRLLRDYRARLALLSDALESTSDLDDTVRLDAIFDQDELAEADACPDDRRPDWIDDLARGLGLRDQLARLPARLHRGQPVFSEARYARHGLTPSSLARHVRNAHPNGPDQILDDTIATGTARTTTDLAVAPAPPLAGAHSLSGIAEQHQALYTELVDEAYAALQRALSDPGYRETFRHASLAPLARLVALRARELRHWQRTRPDLLRERTTLTPLVKFFIAWRHRHGAR